MGDVPVYESLIGDFEKSCPRCSRIVSLPLNWEVCDKFFPPSFPQDDNENRRQKWQRSTFRFSVLNVEELYNAKSPGISPWWVLYNIFKLYLGYKIFIINVLGPHYFPAVHAHSWPMTWQAFSVQIPDSLLYLWKDLVLCLIPRQRWHCTGSETSQTLIYFGHWTYAWSTALRDLGVVLMEGSRVGRKQKWLLSLALWHAPAHPRPMTSQSLTQHDSELLHKIFGVVVDEMQHFKLDPVTGTVFMDAFGLFSSLFNGSSNL